MLLWWNSCPCSAAERVEQPAFGLDCEDEFLGKVLKTKAVHMMASLQYVRGRPDCWRKAVAESLMVWMVLSARPFWLWVYGADVSFAIPFSAYHFFAVVEEYSAPPSVRMDLTVSAVWFLILMTNVLCFSKASDLFLSGVVET